MADEQQLKILKKKGVTAWNRWRGKNNVARPDLSDADLMGANLKDADFTDANLTGALLPEANLTGAKLMRANLSDTIFGSAVLTDADLMGANLTGADLTGANLLDADLIRANLTSADFTGAKVNRDTKGLESLSDKQRSSLKFVDDDVDDSASPLEDRGAQETDYAFSVAAIKGEPEEASEVSDTKGASEPAKRRALRLVRAQRGVLAINGYAFFLGTVKPPQLEDADEQSLIDEFQAVLQALRQELARQDDEIAALFDVIAALEGETGAMKAELQDLQIEAERAAHLGRRCYEKFCLAFSGVLGAGLAAGAIYGASEGGKYVTGQFGGEIFDLLMGGPAAEGPPVPPSEHTVPI